MPCSLLILGDNFGPGEDLAKGALALLRRAVVVGCAGVKWVLFSAIDMALDEKLHPGPVSEGVSFVDRLWCETGLVHATVDSSTRGHCVVSGNEGEAGTEA